MDTRIDRYLDASESADALDSEQRLIRRLGEHYQPPAGHDLALKRVQMRLEHALNPGREMEEKQAGQLATSPGQFKPSTLKVPHIEARRRFSRRLSLLAAVLLLVFLFSGALFVLRQGTPAGPPVHGQKPLKTYTPVSQVQPARFYALSSKYSGLSFDETALTQLDPNSGQVRWQFAFKYEDEGQGRRGSCVGAFTRAGDLLYFEGSDTHGTTIYALNVTDGALRWKALIGGSACEKLVVADGQVFAAQSIIGQDSVQAFNALTGQRLWRQEYPGSGASYIDGFEVIGVRQGILYLSNLLLAQQKSVLYALQTGTGAKIWEQELPHVASVTWALIMGNVLYLAGETELMDTPQTPSTLLALDLSTNKQLWSTSFPGAAFCVFIIGQSIYISTINKNQYGEMVAGSVYVFQEDNGQLLWQQHLKEEIMSMQVADGAMYLELADPGGAITSHSYIDKNGKVHTVVNGPPWHLAALNASNGQLTWRRTLPVTVGGPLLIYHSQLYLTDTGNSVIDVLNIATGQQVKTMPFQQSGGLWMII